MFLLNWSRLTSICIATLAIISLQVDALKINGTLDPCSTVDDCRLGTLCLSNGGHMCTGRKERKSCRCLPLQPIKCSALNRECPAGEGCAEGKSSGSIICVSCNVINDPNSNYIAVSDRPVCVATPTPLPTPTKSPGPARQYLDLCSESDPCERPYQCIGTDGLPCGTIGPCFCLEWKKNPGRRGCKKTADCANPKETCLRDTFDNSTICGSCTVLKTDPSIVAESTDGKCNNVAISTVPIYIPSNGLASDYCDSDAECKSPYQCLKENLKKCQPRSFLCTCRMDEKKGQMCKDESNCKRGEVCAKRRLENFPQCTSSSVYLSYAAGSFEIFGKLPKRGHAGTFDGCKWNYDCQDGLYCSHLSEDKLGQCYGRKGCSCVPPRYVQCRTAKDCRGNERCAQNPGSQGFPICYSKRTLSLDPYYVDVSSRSGRPLTTLPMDGWISSGCSQNDDCKQKTFTRVCQQYLEKVPKNLSATEELCNGRQMCVCKAQKSANYECQSSKTCGDGEVCVRPAGSIASVKGRCESRNVMRLKYFRGSYAEMF